MFKVQTGQTNLPLSQLAISKKSPKHSLSAVHVSSPVVSAAPKLLPAPVLEPTAYSARTIKFPQMPTSPPRLKTTNPAENVHVESFSVEEEFRTPALSKHMQVLGQEQEPNCPHNGQRYAREKPAFREEDLTSSAVRGSAARGFLGLKQSR